MTVDDNPYLEFLASTTTAICLHRTTCKGVVETPHALADQIVDLVLAVCDVASRDAR